MSSFDFEAAHKIFRQMEWTYAAHVPEIIELKRVARILLDRVVIKKTNYWLESGRFRAGMIVDKVTKDSELVLSLEFASVSNYAKLGEKWVS